MPEIQHSITVKTKHKNSALTYLSHLSRKISGKNVITVTAHNTYQKCIGVND